MLMTKEDRTEERRRQNSFGAQQGGDRISHRHGAQGEFLALVDIVFDWDAICRNTIIVLERRGRERASDRRRRSRTSPATAHKISEWL
jgi:hypothetical protein